MQNFLTCAYKRWLAILATGFIIFSPAAQSDPAQPEWLIRSKYDTVGHLPPQFRTMQDSLPSLTKDSPAPSTAGLSSLLSSGSSEFSASGLDEIKQKLEKHKLLVVDLRQEPHGLINGLSISWFAPENQTNWGKSLSQIVTDEQTRLDAIAREGKATRYSLEKTNDGPEDSRAGTRPVETKVNNISSEQKLCESRGVSYIRIPVPDDQAPAAEEVDRFVNLVKGLDKNIWLHFHCAAGHGRTTTFLTMYDMMHNAGSVSCDDIVARQYKLGGIDLYKTNLTPAWKVPFAEKRVLFIKDFYRYCQSQSADGFKRSWADWKARPE